MLAFHIHLFILEKYNFFSNGLSESRDKVEWEHVQFKKIKAWGFLFYFLISTFSKIRKALFEMIKAYEKNCSIYLFITRCLGTVVLEQSIYEYCYILKNLDFHQAWYTTTVVVALP